MAVRSSASEPRKRVTGARTVDEYLALVDEPARAALVKLRAAIRAAAPKAEEVISYQIPTYKLNGPLVHFAAQPNHLSLTVISLDVLRDLADALEGFDVSGRTIRFSAEDPLPAALVKRIVKARVKENEARAKGR